LLRGRAARDSDLNGAFDDLRACVAVVRSVPKDVWETPAYPGKLTAIVPFSIIRASAELLTVMAVDKIENKAERPFYTPKERDAIDLSLGFGVYGKNVNQCLWCGAEPSTGVKLQQCSRCNLVWACSSDCMKQAWKSFHKTQCKHIAGESHLVDDTGMGDDDK